MHLITIIRDYLGLTQHDLARLAGITQADLCEIETKPPYGSIEKYQRLSKVLDIPVHTLVYNDYTGVPGSFFEKHTPAPYCDTIPGIGREGEEDVFAMEQARLNERFETLGRLVLPYYKMKHSGKGYDILSYSDEGKPIFIEVKTSNNGPEKDFRLTVKEHEVAQKLTAKGEQYFVYRNVNWDKPDRKLIVIPFEDMVSGSRIVPTSYTCTMKDRVTMLSGIAFHRQKKGMTQLFLAEKLGIKPTHLYRYESGEQVCSVEKYKQMAELLEVTIDELLQTYPVSALEA